MKTATLKQAYELATKECRTGACYQEVSSDDGYMVRALRTDGRRKSMIRVYVWGNCVLLKKSAWSKLVY